MNSCEQHVRAIAAMPMPTLYTVFAETGFGSEPIPLDSNQQWYVDRIIKTIGRRRLKVKQCYKNAQLMCLQDWGGKLKYHEGYMMSNHCVIAVPHAWNSIDGKIVDVTAEALVRKYPHRRDEKVEYFGIEVPVKLIPENALDTELYCPVSENPKFQPQIFGEELLAELTEQAKSWPKNWPTVQEAR